MIVRLSDNALVIGKKFDFRSGDKLVSVLRPLQLVEMRIGESEVRVAPI